MSQLNLALIISLVDKLSAPLQKVGGALNGFDQKVQKLAAAGERMKAWGEGMQRNALMVGETGRQMREGLMAFVEPAAKMEDVKQQLLAIDGLTETTVEHIMERAEAWQKIHANSDEEFLAGFAQMYQATRNIEQALAGTEVALTVNKAAGGDLAQTVQNLTRLYDNFGDQARPVSEEMARLGDIVVATKQRFNIRELEQFELGLRGTTLAAQTARLDFAQLATVIGAMAGAGKEGRMAGGAISSLLDRMEGAGTKLRFTVAYDPRGGLDLLSTLENIRARFGDLSGLTLTEQQDFDQAFGGPGISNEVSFLLRNLDRIRGKWQEIEGAHGAARKAQEEREKSYLQRMTIFENKWEDLKKTFGLAFLPVLTEILGPVGRLVDRLADFAKVHPGIAKVALSMMALGAAVFSITAPLLSVTGSLAVMMFFPVAAIEKLTKGFEGMEKAVHKLNLALSRNPLGMVALAVAALVAGTVILYKNFDRIEGFFQRLLGTRLGALVTQILYVVTPMGVIALGIRKIQEDLGRLKEFFSAHSGAIGAVLDVLKEKFRALWTWSPLGALAAAWRGVKEFFARHSKEIGAVFNAGWALLKSLFQWSPLGLLGQAWSGTVNFFRRHVGEISALFNAGWAGLRTLFAWSPLGALVAAWQGVTGFLSGHASQIQAIAAGALGVLATLVRWSPLGLVVDAWAPLETFFAALWNSIATIVSVAMDAIMQKILWPIRQARALLGPLWDRFVARWSAPGAGPWDKVAGAIKRVSAPAARTVKAAAAAGAIATAPIAVPAVPVPNTPAASRGIVLPAIRVPTLQVPELRVPEVAVSMPDAPRTPQMAVPEIPRPEMPVMPAIRVPAPSPLPSSTAVVPVLGAPAGGAPPSVGSPARSAPTVIVHQTFYITIQGGPGQDAKAIADKVVREFKARQAQGMREALHDAW